MALRTILESELTYLLTRMEMKCLHKVRDRTTDE